MSSRINKETIVKLLSNKWSSLIFISVFILLLWSSALSDSLLTPEMLNWDGTIATWDPVENAECYHICYDLEYDGIEEPWHCEDDTSDCSFDIFDSINNMIHQEGLVAGNILTRFKVKSIPDVDSEYYKSDYSEYSDILSYEITGYTKLDTPSNLTWMGTIAKD